MSNKSTHYLNKEQEKKSKKKLIVIIAAFSCVFLMTLGLVAAFYSDFLQQTLGVTSGTLRINVTYTYQLNGNELQSSNIGNLNPGDAITVKGTVTNEGNKSAWIRDSISFESVDPVILPFLNVYEGEFTQSALRTEDLSQYLLVLSEDGAAFSQNRVIDGSGNEAETESGIDYNYINASTYDFAYTIYFLSSATNETQGKDFDLSVGVQALQFRNNNFAEPDETAWLTISSAR